MFYQTPRVKFWKSGRVHGRWGIHWTNNSLNKRMITDKKNIDMMILN